MTVKTQLRSEQISLWTSGIWGQVGVGDAVERVCDLRRGEEVTCSGRQRRGAAAWFSQCWWFVKYKAGTRAGV